MSTYTELKGLRIKYLSSDPSPGTAGDVWYNSTSSALKVYAGISAWSSASSLIEARSSGTGFGIQTAAVYAGGRSTTAASTSTYEYNGSGWATSGALNTAKYELGGTTAGTQTAGLCYGSQTSPPGFNVSAACEEYDGTSWTNGNNMATGVSFEGGSGIQTAAFSAGGRTPSNTNNSQEYDGTNWSNGNNINTTRQFLVGMGTQTAGIIAAGESPSGGSNSSETYDGTNWTAGPNLGTARYRVSGSGSVSTASLVFGGRFNPPAADKAQTESFDGTSWTEVADLSTAKQQLSGNRGTSSSAIASGGLPPPANATTTAEEFNNSFQVVTAAAWASSNNVNTARRQSCGAGIQTASIIMGGYGTAFSNATEEYDGSSWTNATNAPFAVYNAYGGGTQTAFIVTGGDLGPAINAETAEWDGSSWTTTNDHPAARNGASGTGSQTAIVSAGGSPHPTATTFYYDGSSWANQSANLGTARYESINSSCGTQAAALLVAGAVHPNTPKDEVEEWNGTAWSEQNDIFTATRQIATSGIQTLALAYGGETAAPAVLATSLSYDGTNWSTSPALGTARRAAGGLGDGATSTAALASSGHNGSANVANTEEFAAATTADTASTIDFD